MKAQVFSCVKCSKMYAPWDLNDDAVCYSCEDEEPARVEWDDEDTGTGTGPIQRD